MKHAVIGKRAGLHLALAFCAMLAGVGAARAGSITYDVDLTIGAGSVVGTVTTNGATGVLDSADFTNWNLELNGPGASFDLTPSNSVAFILGSDATATASNILFNFSGTAGDIFVFQDGLYSGYYYFCAAVTTTTCEQGEGVVPHYYTDPSAQYMSVTGAQIIATVPSTSVPEPATLSLLGLGVAGVGFMRRRKAKLNDTRSSPLEPRPSAGVFVCVVREVS